MIDLLSDLQLCLMLVDSPLRLLLPDGLRSVPALLRVEGLCQVLIILLVLQRGLQLVLEVRLLPLLVVPYDTYLELGLRRGLLIRALILESKGLVTAEGLITKFAVWGVRPVGALD